MQIAQPGRNCWRLESSARVAFLIDGENYYRALAESFARAEREIAIVGWDVNSRARLFEGEGPDGLPCELGPMLDALVARNRRLHAWVLEWDFPMLYALDRELLPIVRFGLRTHRRVHFRLDSSHPFGGSHHQKLVVIDGKIAFVGGMDVTHARWDTCDHTAQDPRRVDPWGRIYPPYHDVQVVCDGAAAAALADLARERWKRAGGRMRRPVRTAGDPWPVSVRPEVERVEVAIARTEPPYAGRPAVTEVADAWMDLLSAARRSVYIENQYLTSAAFGEALAKRLGDADCPEIVIVITHASSGWLEEASMGVLRARLIDQLQAADPCHRLRVYYVCAGKDVDVKIHSKLIIVDDEIVRVGSANLNNRSMGLDTECDVWIESGGRSDVSEAILALRDRLLGEHLGVAPAEVRTEIARRGSLAAAIESLRGGEHTLVPLEVDRDSWMDVVLPDGSMMDPERPVAMNELIAQLAPEDLVSLRAPLGRTAIAIAAAAAGIAALSFATPLPAEVAEAGLAAWLAPWRESAAAAIAASGVVALGAMSMAPLALVVALCGFLFGPWIGFAAAFAGTLLGAAAGYAIGARLRRDTIRRLVGSHVERLSRQLQLGGLPAMLAARLASLAPFGAVNVVAGATRFPFRGFLLGTLCAIAPGMVALVALGHGAAWAISVYGSAALAGATAVALAVTAAALGIRRHRARARERGAAA